MPVSYTQVARVQQYVAKLQALEDRLMGKGTITLVEQAAIHTEIRRLKKEMEELEKRTR